MKTHSQIYSTNLRNQSMILNGENSHIPSLRYLTLIKKFSKKRKISLVSKPKIKPKRINAKSTQNHKPDKYLNKQPKNKTITKQKVEKTQKQSNYKDKNNKNEINKNKTKKNLSKSTGFKQENINNTLDNINEIDKENEEINNLLSDITTHNTNRINNYINDTLQNKNNNYFNAIKLSKSPYNENEFKRYFDIFKLRRDA